MPLHGLRLAIAGVADWDDDAVADSQDRNGTLSIATAMGLKIMIMVELPN